VVSLKVFCDKKLMKEFSFSTPAVFILGRSPQCHCSFPDDPYLSSNHFLLEIAPPQCSLRDLGSRNGTFVNGVRFGMRRQGESPKEAAQRAQRIALKTGDTILAGTVEVSVSIDSAVSTPPPRQEGPGEGPGLKVPGYEIIRELGRGSMGVVYLARSARYRRVLALKILWVSDKALSAQEKESFQREVDAAKVLRHPNIVSFYGGGSFGPDIYFAMEYCDGGSLAALMEKSGGRLSLEVARPIMLQVLDGLEYAHARNLVHRDIKPENILLKGGGPAATAKISDFGLAKNFMLAGLSGISNPDTGAGTPGYMSKEQLLNFMFTKPVSDVFSVGATFYALLTGRYVYDFEAVEDSLQAVLEGRVVPIAERGVPLPRKLMEVIDRAVSVDPEKRYPTAAQMKKALAEAWT
jgi:eukaryotic-like serine/threonine-protein kinase